MADYRNILIDVESLDEGKFYKLYTDSNATALLIPKGIDDKLELDVEQLKVDVDNLLNKGSTQTITITNNNEATSPADKKIIKVRGNMNIKIAELSARAVIINYCLHKDDKVEVGRLTIIDGTPPLIETDRTYVTSLLPVIFTANRNDDVLNLNLSIDSSEIYTFEYTTLIF